ncbi:rRNA maturation RNase YbeY [Neptunomonas japonica]|uniref:rRNA maturation RNase YbeY n=1 Tax=Neptunomonas japonica TaxID=417574 RepID=UPI00040371D6|nr:rRNA maturation RNase YbeY [Neptunomonas japonica]
MNYDVDIQREVDNTNLELPSDEDFQHWVTLALTGRKSRGEICIRLVEPTESQQLNNDYRGKDAPTNVLSFPFDGPEGIPMDLLGDLAICADIVTKEAQEQNKPVRNHWAHMVIHGTLHLIGFDHINDSDAEQMETLEIALLASINIPDPYQQGV